MQWPSAEQQAAARSVLERFINSLERQTFSDAYDLLTDRMQQSLPRARFVAINGERARTLGKSRAFNVTRISWKKDDDSDAKQVFFVADFVARYDLADRVCGYIVLQQFASSNAFRVMRLETTFLPNATAHQIELQQSDAAVDALWAKMSGQCPGYQQRN